MSTISYSNNNHLSTANGSNGVNFGGADTSVVAFTPQQNIALNNIQAVIQNGGTASITGTMKVHQGAYNGTVIASSSATIPASGTVVVEFVFNKEQFASGQQYTITIATASGSGQFPSDLTADGAAANGGISWTQDYTTPPRVALTWDNPNTAPNAPTHSGISSNGGTYNQNPKFFASVSDPDAGNTITNVEVQVSTVSTFATTLTDDQYGSDSGYGTFHSVNDWTGLPTASNAASTITWKYPYANLTPGTYFIRFRCKDNNGAWSTWSATQQFSVLAVPWADVLTAGNMGFKAQWLNDLATAIQNVQKFRGWNAFPFSYGTLTVDNLMQAFHVVERRKLLAYLMSVYSNVTPAWTDADLTNLLTINQATGGWNNGQASDVAGYSSQNSGTLAYDGTTSFNGYSSFKMSSTYAGSQSISIHSGPVYTAVSGTKNLNAQLIGKGPAGKTYNFNVWFVDASYNSIGNAYSKAGTFSGGWDLFTAIDIVPPAGTAKVRMEIALTNAANGDAIWWNTAFLVEGSPLNLDRNQKHLLEMRNYITQA